MLLPSSRTWARLACLALFLIFILSFFVQTRSTTLSRYIVSQASRLQRTDRDFDPGSCSLEDEETSDRLDWLIAPEVLTVSNLESYILDLLNLTERGADLPPWLRYNVDNFKPRQWEDFEM